MNYTGNSTAHYRDITLADGTIVHVAAGGPLPDGLPLEFEFLLIADEVADIGSQHVFVKTTLRKFLREVRHYREATAESRSRIHFGASKCIKEFLPRCDEVYGKVQNGDTKAAQEWQDFCDDIAILASHKALQDKELRVLLDVPKVSPDMRAIYGPVFILKM